jgi:mono/diheme cytochrome c family protein
MTPPTPPRPRAGVRPFRWAAAVVLGTLSGAARLDAAPPVDFNRDIRPILSNNCYQCHGPDENERKADLRLDTSAGATADLGGTSAVVPGKPAASGLIARVTSTDPGEQMPPRKSGKKLSPREVQLLTRWIEEGARYAQHWSHVKPVRPPLPAVRDTKWAKTPIDTFLLARLEVEGLRPSPEADRHALVRRVTLDLTGLPPTLAEVEAFVKDPSPDAYEPSDPAAARRSWHGYGPHGAERHRADVARRG